MPGPLLIAWFAAFVIMALITWVMMEKDDVFPIGSEQWDFDNYGPRARPWIIATAIVWTCGIIIIILSLLH